MIVEPRGPRKYRRFALTLQGRVWDGKQWVKKGRKPLLFATAVEANAERERLRPKVAEHSTVSLFSFPLQLHITSAFPFDVHEMRRYLERQIRYTFAGMAGAPEGAACSFHHWGPSEIQQRGPLPDPETTHAVIIEVPLKIQLLAKGKIDLPKVTRWLDAHVQIGCDELLPECVPVGLTDIGVAWKKAKVVSVPK